jgi:tartrate-resistant acid phosphatase type 5
MTRMSLSRRSVLLGAVPAVGLLSLPAQARAPGLDFVVIGDWGRDGRWRQRAVAEQMGRSAAAVGSAFVISVGDNFYEDGVTGVDDPRWKSSFENIYTHPALATKWHVILGNHDYQGSGNPQAQIDYSATSSRWSLPAAYYTRTERLADGTTVAFFFLDTSRYIREYHRSGSQVHVQGREEEAQQVAWLEQELAKSTAAWKIVVGHHQLYTAAAHHDYKEMIEPFRPLFDRYGVQTYFNGHEHNLAHVRQGNVHYLTCGAGSLISPVDQTPWSLFASDHHGFMTVRLEADTLGIAFVDDFGTQIYQASIPRVA